LLLLLRLLRLRRLLLARLRLRRLLLLARLVASHNSRKGHDAAGEGAPG
jgi:hypothetical protein